MSAESDLAEAVVYYDGKRQGLGGEFLICFEQALDRIRRMPEAAILALEDVRWVSIRRFPFGVFYVISDDGLVVLAVYHVRRDSKGWQERVQKER